MSFKYIADYKPLTLLMGGGSLQSVCVGLSFPLPGCYNVAAQNFSLWAALHPGVRRQIIADLGHSYVQGLTREQPFLKPRSLELVKRIATSLVTEVLVLVGYTGRSYCKIPDKLELLHLIDILIDGRFCWRKRSYKQFAITSELSTSQSLPKVIVIWDKLFVNDNCFNSER